MTHAEATARLATAAPKCPYCGEPGRVLGTVDGVTTVQCQFPNCPVRGSWGVVETEGVEIERRAA